MKKKTDKKKINKTVDKTKQKIKRMQDMLSNHSPIKSPGDGFRAGADKIAEYLKWPSEQVQNLQEKTLAMDKSKWVKVPLAAVEDIALRLPADMLAFAAYLARTTFANNMTIRGMERYFAEDEKHHKNKKGEIKWSRQNPAKAAYLRYYLMLAILIAGGYIGNKIIHKDKVQNKKETVNNHEAEPTDPSIKKTGDEWIALESTRALGVALPLVFEECYLKAKKTAEGKWNIGYCMTRIPTDKRNPYGKWRTVQASDECTEDQAALWAGIYNEKFVFPILKKLTVRVSRGMLLALVDFSYNAGATGKMVARLNDGMTEKEALDIMRLYDKAHIDGKLVVVPGLVTRRWWGYAAASGNFDYGKLLDAKLTCVSEAAKTNDLYSDRDKKKPITTKEKINTVLTTPVASRSSVAGIFQRSSTGKGYIAAIQSMSDKTVADNIIDDDEYVENQANDLGFQAQSAFDAGDFNTAEEKFRELIRVAPDSYDSYNDLAFTLYKLGRYDEGIKVAKNLIDMGHQNDISEDNVFGSAYFNVGLCREAKGELETARKNYITAGKRMPDNEVVKKALERIGRKIDQKNAEKSQKAVQIKSGQDTVKAKFQQKQQPRSRRGNGR